MTRGGIARTAVVALALAAGACTLGPDFERPKPPEAAGYSSEALAPETAASAVAGGAAQRFAAGRDIPGDWWTLFQAPHLNALIDRALAANPSLQAAQAALRQASENVAAQQGALYPSINATAGLAREQVSQASSGIKGTTAPFNLYNASVSVSYAPDVFGGTRRQIESLAAQAEVLHFQLEAAYLALTANVVTAAVQEASLRAQIAATEEIVAIELQELAVLQRQFSLGGTSKAAVLAQEATLAQARATLPPLQKQLAQERDLLAALAGRLPSEAGSERFELAAMELPLELPLTLPSKLVEQRPDVRAAEAQMHAASAAIGVARANQFPQFTLGAGYGTAALTMGALFSPGAEMWNLAGGVSQSVFDADTLYHRRLAAVAGYDQAEAQYRSTVLGAFQNVADSLRALQSDAEALKAQVAAERSAADSLALTRQQFQAGAITYVTLLAAEQTLQQARIGLVVAKASRFADTAALFQALGGGWWNRTDVKAADDAAHP